MTVDIAHHHWRIDPAQYERHEQRRGRRHAFETLVSQRTALVVIDMVPFFVDLNPYTRGIIANVNDLAGVARRANALVVWVVPADVEPSPARVEFFGPDVAELYRRSGGTGSTRHRLAPDLETTGADLFIEKSTASAFFPGGATLHDELVDRDIDTVLLAGTVANVCVESSARDASSLGYRVVMVADAISATRDEDLNATLHTLYRSFADVRSSDELAGMLGPEISSSG